MSVALSLSNLSIESAEVDFTEQVDPEAGFREQIENPIFSKEHEDAELVFSTFQRIHQRGFVCRADLDGVAHLADQYRPIQRLLARYPLASFTEEPSLVNMEVSNESLVRSVLSALKEAFLRIIKFLRESFTRVWDNLTSGRKRTMAVDKLGVRVDAMQRYIVEVDRIMNDASVAEYGQWQRRNVASAANNISKNWNALKNEVVMEDGGVKDAVSTMIDVLVLRTVPMATMLETLLTDLQSAKSPGEIGAAVAKAQMFSVITPNLTKLAASIGWKLNNMRVDPRLTPFKSMSSYLAGAYRSMSNNRQEVKPERLLSIAATMKVDTWADLVPHDLADSRKRLDASLRKLEDWDSESYLDPGLEATYTGIVIPFISMVSVNVAALSDLQATVSMVMTTRDSCILDVANAMLGIVKGMDSFVGKNREKLPPAAMVQITRYKAAVANS